MIHRDHCRPIRNILIIEDSRSLAHHIKETIDTTFDLHCDIAYTEEDAKRQLSRKRFDLLFLDIFLPDSSGHLINYLVRQRHRVILMTGSGNEELRESHTQSNVVDYIIKSDERSLMRYILKSISRLRENKEMLVMICDDSSVVRKQVASLLGVQNFQYVEAVDGAHALELITEHDIPVDIILTDYEMPRLDGVELVRRLRHDRSEDELPVLAFSASEKKSLLAQFLKAGANDYIIKPFSNEEFFTRLNLTADHLYTFRHNQRLIARLEEMAIKDHLTGLYNRRYFYDYVPHLLSSAKRSSTPFTIMMIDIDHFKKINDTYGHKAGDKILVRVSRHISDRCREDSFLFRWGGEEFLLLTPNSDLKSNAVLAERIRSAVEQATIQHQGVRIGVTVSIGIASGMDDIERIITLADSRLYDAKESGRNRVR